MALIKPTNDTGSASTNQISSIVSTSTATGKTIFGLNSHKEKGTWILDSGAKDHVVSSLNLFQSYEKINPITINLPNGMKTKATHKGVIQTYDKIILKDVLFILDFCYNLISISKLVAHNHLCLTFNNTVCSIQDMTTNKKIGSVNSHASLYIFSDSNNIQQHLNNSANIHQICKVRCNNLWHNRLGHMFDRRLDILKQKYHCIDSRFDKCNACHSAKQKRLPFPSSTAYALHPFDVIHVDIWGPCSVVSLHSHKYFLTIIDDHTRYTWVHLMKTKSETRQHLIHFIAYVKNQFKTTIKVIRSDNGSEFNMHDYYKTEGIFHQTSCNETPQQNGIAERKHQHLLNVTRALIFYCNISIQFWTYALNYATLLINIMPTPFLQDSSPYDRLYKKDFDISRLKVFGCLCYVSTLQANRKKLDPRAKPSLFFGIHPTTKGYITYDLDKHDIKISRNVIFYETDFPDKNSTIADNLHVPLPLNNNQIVL
ncbi:hypothetical protein V8G54_022439 [Vigna mungo]|uniref:Integrase catalytic domain-containing protein n=1 Tax=Vigna mungo TaxID=3915 RepID=A0AAQ3RXW3_VIGMU